MQKNIQKETECMEQDVSYLKDKLGWLASKMGSFDSKTDCWFGKHPAKLPANLTPQRTQLDEH